MNMTFLSKITHIEQKKRTNTGRHKNKVIQTWNNQLKAFENSLKFSIKTIQPAFNVTN